MEYRTLGPLEVRHHGERLQLGGVKQRSLLALLLLHCNEVVSTDRLIDALWAGTPPATARQSLHNFVAALRRTLSIGRDAPVLHTCDPGYRLDVRPGELDLDRFRRLVEDARRALDGHDAATAAHCLRVALALWRGPFLADLSDAGVHWAHRPEVSEERLSALELRIDADLALGRHDAVVAELEPLVTAHPLRERFTCQLMLALYRGGRQADALATYRAARETIVAQLGVEPGRELQAMQRAVLAQHPSLGGDHAGGGRAGAPSGARPPRMRDERRPVTVVLASVDGTAGWDGDDPEDVRRVLTAGLDTVRRAVMRAGGVVPHVLGSTAMGVFGVPHAREDDAERAVQAALAIRDATLPGDGMARLAVATGEALLISDPAPGEPAVTGHVVTASTGLLEVAPAGSVLVTPATARATQRHVAYRAVELPSVAGRPAPAAFEAVRIRAGPPFERAELGRAGWSAEAPADDATPWRGRQRELGLLVSHFDRARSGDPRLVTVVGEAGLGKSRLVAELANLLRQRGCAMTWCAGRTPSYGAAMPMRALHDLVRHHAGIMETDPPAVAARKLDAVLCAAIADADQRAWVGRHLRVLAGGGAADQNEPGRQHEAFAAWSRFVAGLAGNAAGTPLVLVFEELHWADDALLDFVASLPDRVGSTPLLVLALARPELLDRRPSWAVSSPSSTVLRLPPLAGPDMAALAADLVDRHDLPGDLVSTLVERAGGNALFAEEYARMLADLHWGGDVATSDERPRRLPLPESVHTIIAARLDRLRDEDRRVLEDAAVVGPVAWTGVIAAVGDHEPAALDASLRRLERRELIRRVPASQVAGQAEYAFAHVLVRDVAYSRIPRAARADKHTRAATWIDGLPGQGATDRAELLAHHFQRALEAARGAGQPVDDLERRAGVALRAAGDRAAGLGAYGAAARWYADALELWPVSDATRAELLFRLGAARFYQEGDGERTLRSARDALLEVGDCGRAAEVEVMLGLVAWRRGHNDRAMMQRARELVATAQRPRSKAFVLSRCALRFAIDDQAGAALATGAEALRLAEDFGLVEDAAKASTAIGMARISQGEVEGLDDLRRAAISLERARSPAAANALINLATMRAWLGDLHGCFAAQARARTVAEHFASAAELRWLDAEAVLERYWTGDVASAAARAQEFIIASTAGERHYLEPSCRVVRGRFLLERGRVDAADRDAAQALTLARKADDVQMLAPALLLRARVSASTGDVAVAWGFLDEALDALRGRLLLPEIGVDLAITLSAVRSGGALAELDGAGIAPSAWLDATRAFVAGHPAAAAAIYARIGSVPDARTAAANALAPDPLGVHAAGVSGRLGA